jgi:hypothetical protein
MDLTIFILGSRIRGDNHITVGNRLNVQGDNVVMFGPNANPMYYQSQNLDGFFRNDQNGQDARNNRNERSGFRIDRLFSNHKRW